MCQSNKPPTVTQYDGANTLHPPKPHTHTQQQQQQQQQQRTRKHTHTHHFYNLPSFHSIDPVEAPPP